MAEGSFAQLTNAASIRRAGGVAVGGEGLGIRAVPELKFTWICGRYSDSSDLRMFRAKVPGGWLVLGAYAASLVFVPDPTHSWDGGSLP